MASVESASAVDAAPPIPHLEPASSSSTPDFDSDPAQTQTVLCPWTLPSLPHGQCARYLDCPSHAIPRVESNSASASPQPGFAASSQSHIQGKQPEVNEPAGSSILAQESVVQCDAERSSDQNEVAPIAGGGSASAVDQADALAESTALESPHETGASTNSQESAPSESNQPIRPEQPLQDIQSAQSAPDSQTTPLSGVLPSEPELPPLPTIASQTEQSSSMSRRRVAPLWKPLNERPSTPQTPSRPSQGLMSPEIRLPRWQPDAEATYCPICSSQFNIFVRKHHCRKCGRVVCNACSPHRIVIPYQYIVRPPGQTGPQWNEYDSSPTISGGERARLCNPCVPDPNTAPPLQSPRQLGSPLQPPQQQQQQYTPRTHQRSHSGRFFVSGSGAGSGSGPGSGPGSGAGGSGFGAGAGPEGTRGRSATVVSFSFSAISNYLWALFIDKNSRAPPSSQHYTPRATPTSTSGGGGPSRGYPGYDAGPSSPYALSYESTSVPRSSQRYQSLIRGHAMAGPSSSSSAAAASSSSSSHYHQRSLPLPPPLAEEDECPVCHLELPSRMLPNFESLRETHIAQCIVSHSAYRGSPGATGSDGRTASVGEASVTASRRRTGMFPYLATEKDCVDSAECTICLEEFEVGEQMARLECLCRFHMWCIRAWFNKHPGRCPVHQHDSFGF
ncbi:hypothetical protein TD95_004225 [Thielaviopsis punctulata]|uniref:FYVE-type domain-containing protein n=1 Tax=Thielaviopsis punctulata TaxID=72032 RepID=A0A0F4ZE52_9PEZI|nr:hypothetical protein TD95_004225 [Thielaviopsis punctulata]